MATSTFTQFLSSALTPALTTRGKGGGGGGGRRKGRADCALGGCGGSGHAVRGSSLGVSRYSHPGHLQSVFAVWVRFSSVQFSSRWYLCARKSP